MTKAVRRISKEELEKSVPGCTLGEDGKNRNPHLCYMTDCNHCGWFRPEIKRRKKLLRNDGLRAKGYGGIRYLCVSAED